MRRPRHELEVVWARGRRHAAWYNKVVHDAPWIDGDETPRGGLYIALDLAQQAYRVHGLPYMPGVSHMHLYDPRRFTWVLDPDCDDVRDCLQVRDNKTGRKLVWR
jgi:hypothetical protein